MDDYTLGSFERICPQCGKKFTTPYPGKVYHSLRCRTRAQQKRIRDRARIQAQRERNEVHT